MLVCSNVSGVHVSFVCVRAMRHCLLCRLSSTHEYVPNYFVGCRLKNRDAFETQGVSEWDGEIVWNDVFKTINNKPRKPATFAASTEKRMEKKNRIYDDENFAE